MKDLVQELAPLFTSGERFAIAIVTNTWSSAPRGVGAAMAVTQDGRVLGSVSGGCVEGAVYEAAREVLQSGITRRLTFGVSDDDAFSVGLTCGGTIALVLYPVDRETWPAFAALADALTKDQPVALVVGPDEEPQPALVVTQSTHEGTAGSQRLDSALVADVLGFLEAGRTGMLHYGREGERRPDDRAYLVISFAARPTMYVFGAIDFARAVAEIGVFLGYRTVVCDARATFATVERFPGVDEVVVDWPHRYLQTATVDANTVIAVLTHDPKFDVPLLEVALQTSAGYIGVMGSRRTHERRIAELRERGVSETQIERLRAPIGLDLGARTPEETAVSIAAEIIQEKWSGSGLPLRSIDGPIHK